MIHPLLFNIIVTSISCTVVLLIILLIRKFIGLKTGASWRSLIWVILLIRLCIPIIFNTPLGLIDFKFKIPYFSESINIQENSIDTNSTSGDTNTRISESIEDSRLSDAVVAIKDINTLVKVLHTIYLMGISSYLAIIVLRFILLNIKVKRMQVCEDNAVIDIFEITKNKLCIKKQLLLLVDKNNGTPSMGGSIKPYIIIPQAAIDNSSRKDLEHIFLHELTHYKDIDILKLYLIELAMCIHWFNPILYFIKAIIIQDIELACDERVLSKINKVEYADYGKVLLDCSANLKRKSPFTFATDFAGKRDKNLKERLIMIKLFNKNRMKFLGVILMVSISALMIACTTSPTIIEPTTNDITVTKNSENNEAINTNNGVSDTTYNVIKNIIKNKCTDVGIENEEEVYDRAVLNLISLVQNATYDLGPNIRNILHEDIGLSVYDISNAPNQRLDIIIAETILPVENDDSTFD